MLRKSSDILGEIVRISREIIDLLKQQEALQQKRKTAKFMSEKYIELQKEEQELLIKIDTLDKEKYKLEEEYFSLRTEENNKEISELQNRIKELENSGLLNNVGDLKKSCKILETPDKYTKEEIEEAQNTLASFMQILSDAGIAVPIVDKGMIE